MVTRRQQLLLRRALKLEQNGLQQWAEAKATWDADERAVDPDVMLRNCRENFDYLKRHYDRVTARLRHSRGASD